MNENNINLVDVLLFNAKYILSLINIIDKVKSVELFLAFVYKEKWLKKFKYYPLLCYKDGEKFYHVSYNSGWDVLGMQIQQWTCYYAND